MTRCFGLMPRNEVEKICKYEDRYGDWVIIEAGPRGWSVIYCDNSCSYKDEDIGTEQNFINAYNMAEDSVGHLIPWVEEDVVETVSETSINQKDGYSSYLTRSEILNIVEEVAYKINRYCATNSINNLIVIGVLNGALYYTSELTMKLETDIELHTIHIKSYENNSNENTTLTCLGLEYVPIKDKTILIVDDVYDSGQTLDWLKSTLYNLGAKKVLSTVLMDKLPGHPDKDSKIDFVGHIMKEKKFLVGYGMDDNGQMRNLDHIVVKLD